MSNHAILSPSAASRWLACLGSVIRNLGAPDDSSEFADQGTAAHTLGSQALTDRKSCAQYLGQVIDVEGRRQYVVAEKDKPAEDGKPGAIDVSYVQVYVDSVMDQMHDSAILLVEQHVSSGVRSLLYGDVDGTGDAMIFAPEFKLIEIHDLKYGQGEQVEATENPQLRLYGLGAVAAARAVGLPVEGDWKVRMVIHQPRRDHMSEEVLTVAELQAWGAWAQSIVDRIDAGEDALTPGEKQCRWCPQSGHKCPAQTAYVMNTITSEFPPVADMTDWGIGKAMERVELIEQWVKAVKSQAWQTLDSGLPVPGWKLVVGRQGNCKWKDEEQVEKILRDRFRMTREEMYKTELITPTVEWQKKFAKTHPQRAEELQEYITRSPGAKTMVRDTDTKPAIGGIESYFK